jgi:ketosteroid isomerase-like protein
MTITTDAAVERRNLRTIERWAALYNTDVTRMVRKCYHPDCVVDVKGGITFQGHETFIAIERGVERVAPRRRTRVLRAVAAGDTVAVQAVLTDPDRGAEWQSPFCAVLTLHDGLILRDESYLDLRVWPSPKLTREQWSRLNVLAR